MFLIHLFINVSQPLQKYFHKKYRIVITWLQRKLCPNDELGKCDFLRDTEMRQSGIEPIAVFHDAHVQH